MKTTSKIEIIFNRPSANRIYQVGLKVVGYEVGFSLRTSEGAKNPDTLVFKRDGLLTKETVKNLISECNDALVGINEDNPIYVKTIHVEKITSETSTYEFTN